MTTISRVLDNGYAIGEVIYRSKHKFTVVSISRGMATVTHHIDCPCEY